eukprot:9473699-Pyramimonas_sp.AAC.1
MTATTVATTRRMTKEEEEEDDEVEVEAEKSPSQTEAATPRSELRRLCRGRRTLDHRAFPRTSGVPLHTP